MTSLKKWLDNDDLRVGISELSKMSQTSPRQLRYWEEKGIISSINPDSCGPRTYRLKAVVTVELIRHYLDEGYTLAKAAEKAASRIKKVQHVRTVFAKFIRNVEIIDDRFVLFTIGQFEEPQENLVIIHDSLKDTLHYQPIAPNERIDFEQICTRYR